MSLIITNIALHFLSKQETGEVNLRLGPEIADSSPRILSFVDALHKAYNAKANKAYGAFTSTQKESSSFSRALQNYQSDGSLFHEFSTEAATLLKAEVEKYDLAEKGYLLISHYEYMGGRYLIVAVIPISEHYSVDSQINILAEQHLDISRIQLAARIDLFDQQSNPSGNRYISFIKGRAGRKVSDFFLDFLGCEEGISAKEQTQTLIKAVEDYTSVNQFDADEKQQARRDVVNYCKEQKESSQDVSVQELSQILSDDSISQPFDQFCSEHSYPMAPEFPHEQSIVNKITKYSGYGNGIAINFERHHFGKDVVYNPTNDSLTIYKVPPNLKDQLLALFAEQNNN